MKKTGSAADPVWYKDAILYELHVRSFADSNGDGIGDFPGLISKLPYLQQLGVTCLWIMPFFPSPLLDDGYDISDYKSINPNYGTLDDFQKFLNEAHKCGMQVLIELVMNHTSSQHPWFQRARLAPAGSVERDFYVWSDNDQRFPGVPIIFSDTEKSNWSWDPVANAYYWHRFFSHQPDLNFDNPVVLEEMLNTLRFWLDMGVDGLRLDAIPYLVERDGTRCESLPETHAIIRKMRSVVDEEYENRFFLAEANQWPTDVRPYFGNGDECHMAFHFPLMPRMYVAIRQEDCTPIIEIMHQTPQIPDTCQWGLFLRNHDELTLEMVTEDERDYMYLAYSADKRSRVNLGIRRRLAPLLDNNRQRIELLNSLLYSFPGTPILYYGDEIGMGDNIDLGDRNSVRTPMQWNSTPNGGFSTASIEKLSFPVIDDPVYGFQAVNVAEQIENPSSTLQWTRNMIALRKLFPVFGRGSLRFLNTVNRKVLAYLREFEGETVLCVANLSRFAQPVTMNLEEFKGRIPVELFGYTPFPVVENSPYTLTLSPYAFLWFQLQPLYDAATTNIVVPPEQEPETLASAVAEEPVVSSSTTGHSDFHLHRISSQQEATLLLHIAPDSIESLRTMASASARLAEANSNLRVVLAFPVTPAISAGNDNPETMQVDLARELNSLAPSLAVDVYTQPPNALPQLWPHPARTYSELGRIAQQHEANAVLLLGPDAGSLNAEAIPALAQAILADNFDLAVPLYQASRYDGLLNTGILHPLTKALYGADIRYPLALDMAFSGNFCKHLATAANKFDVLAMDEGLMWPVPEAALHGFKMAQVSGCKRHFTQPSSIDVTKLLTSILSSLFADTEKRAIFWQRSYPVTPLRNMIAATLPEPTPDQHDQAVYASSMFDSFHLAAGHLQGEWAAILSPGTQLRLHRLIEMPADKFAMTNVLWVNLIYDFLASYHTRSLNRMHLVGALVPLYLGWAASHVMKVAGMTEAEAEAQISTLAATFSSEKPYLMSRWRWPDRFTP